MTMNVWKSYIWTADKDVNMRAIFAGMSTTCLIFYESNLHSNGH